jgi:hypothetical protein
MERRHTAFRVAAALILASSAIVACDPDPHKGQVVRDDVRYGNICPGDTLTITSDSRPSQYGGLGSDGESETVFDTTRGPMPQSILQIDFTEVSQNQK